jgi:hypothetical protein
MIRIEYPEDCKRIQRVLLDKLQMEATLAEVQDLWTRYSRSRACSFQYPTDNDDELAEELRAILNP